MVPCWQAVWGVTFKICVIFGVRLKDGKVDKKQSYTNTEACELYFRVFWIFLPNFIKIDPYTFELYHFKFCTFFQRHSVVRYAQVFRSHFPALITPSLLPLLSIFCWHLKSHLFSLSYPAFWLWGHMTFLPLLQLRPSNKICWWTDWAVR